MSSLAFEIAASGPRSVLDEIADLGRTEDLRFSPDGRRLAIASFHRGAIAVVDVEVSGDRHAPAVTCSGVTRLTSPGLRQPHGVDWLDEQTLIVADRAGWMGLLAVPDACPGEAVELTVDLLEFDGEFAHIYGPGSVRVTDRGHHATSVLVCNNWGNNITEHRLMAGDRWSVAEGRIALGNQLDLPDGLAVSADGSWVAVSNHNRQAVVVYPHAAPHDPADRSADRLPVGVLRGTSYPHGLCFTRAGDRLAVADAGSPFIHLYDRAAPDWSFAAFPAAAVQVLTSNEFTGGNTRADEGGPKGIDLDPTERVLAVTCGAAPLRWFHWTAAQAAGPRAPGDLAPVEVAGLERETALKASLAQVELRLLEAETREHDAQVQLSLTRDRVGQLEQLAQEQHEQLVQAHRFAHDLQDQVTRTEQLAREHHDRADAELETMRRSADEARQHLAAIEATKTWQVLAPIRRLYASMRGRGTASPGT